MAIKREEIKYDDIASLPNEYIPIIHNITVVDKKSYDAKPELTPTMCYPLFSHGFQEYLHANKNKMSVVNEFKGKKKTYLVIQPFESKIDEYDASLDNVSVDYFGLDEKPPIISRAFYKLWELIVLFDVIPTNVEGFRSAHVAEAPGAFAQATMFYRDLFAKKGTNTKKDKYYIMSVDPSEDPDNIPRVSPKLIQYYEKEKPQRLYIHKTHSPIEAEKSPTKDDGDLLNPKTIKLFSNELDKKMHFITADGGFVWANENTQEQEVLPLFVSEILVALKNLEVGGSFICKIFETYTMPFAKIIYILSTAFEESYIVKPLTSHASNSEKYLVFKKYLGKPKIVEQFVDMHEKLFNNKKKNILDIFPDLSLPTNYLNILIKNNLVIANKQLIYISKIIEFIQSRNYFGDVYQDSRLKQIEASKYWINTYYPNKNEFNKMSKLIEEIKKRAII